MEGKTGEEGERERSSVKKGSVVDVTVVCLEGRGGGGSELKDDMTDDDGGTAVMWEDEGGRADVKIGKA